MGTRFGDDIPIRLKRGHGKRHEPQILIAPLIDIVFLLLIFFILVARFIAPSIAIALPESGTDTLDESHYITVAIDGDGNIWLDERPMSLEEITVALEDAWRNGEFNIVRLRADRDTPLQTVVDALDAIRAAGISDVAIETSRDGMTEEELATGEN
jgi:biopolymer transport protein ExbD